jgi:O-antigen/teichoic acid export membrane protein
MKKSQDLSTRILKGSLVVLLTSLLISPFGYLIRSYYSHTLSIESFGLFFAVLTFFNMISTYSDLGFGATISYLLPKHMKSKDYSSVLKVFRYGQMAQIGSAILIALILIPLSGTLADNYFKVPNSENLIYIMCLYLVGVSFLNSIIQVFIGLQEEKYYSSINLVRLIFALIFSLFFSFYDAPNILYYAAAWTISYFITAVIYSYILSRNHSEIVNQKLHWDSKLFKSMRQYAFPTLATTSIAYFITFSDSFFLTLMRDVREVGIYNIVLPLASIPIMFLSPLHNLLFPLISHLSEGERNKIKYLVGKVLQIVPLVGVYFSLFIILFPTTIVSLIFGSKWIGLVETPLIILSLGYIATGLYTTLGIIVAGFGEVRKRVKITSIIAITNVILSIILVPSFGVTGAVSANTLIAIASVVMFGRIVNSVVPFTYPYYFYLKLGIFSALLYFLIRLFNFYPTNWTDFLISGVIYTVIFTIFSYYLKVFDKSVLTILKIKK